MKDNTTGDRGPAQDPRILEAIEACRPGSDDLSDPDLAFLATELAAKAELDSAFERSQQVDGLLTEVFQNQPVPEGLEQRILARLEAARAEEDASDELAPDEPATPRPATGHRRVSRRTWLSVGGATAVAASLLVATLLHWQAPNEYTGQDVLELAIDLFNTPSSDSWQTSSPPSAYPLSPKVVATDIRWRKVPSFLGHRAVAYDLSTPGGTQATLFVVKCPVDGLSTAPPLRPALMTGGRSTSAWQSGSLVYVLVVRGEARGYRRLLNIPRGPVA